MLKGEDNGGFAKKHVCLILAGKHTTLTLCKTTCETILPKMLAMEDCWRQTHDWINNTGRGVLNEPEDDLLSCCQQS